MKNERKHFDFLKDTVEYEIRIDIPIGSEEYQAFLEANRRREKAREENGGPDPEAEDAHFKAVQGVSNLAKKIISNNTRVPLS